MDRLAFTASLFLLRLGGVKYMEGDDFVAKYEEWGEEEVRSKLALNIITGRGLLPAQDWLRRKDSERAIQDRVSSLQAQEEQTALAKRAAASAE